MKKPQNNREISLDRELAIEPWELTEQFIKSSGPGGQNVNKVSTAVQLRWNLDTSSLPRPVKARFKRLWASRLTSSGDLIIESKKHRSQSLNREAARKRLAEMINAAIPPPKTRRVTRPGRKAVLKRLDDKKRRSETKSRRGRVRFDDQ
ncbi:MAG: alternative ribosome rescue aminoacyl-tRNA hydrolase ArfB [Pseudomonadota bacterium]